MEVFRAYKLKTKFTGSGRSLVQVPTPKRFNLIVPGLRRPDPFPTDDEGKPKKPRLLVLLFENGAMYVFKKDDKFYIQSTSGQLIEFTKNPVPEIEKHPGFGRDFIPAVVEEEKPKDNVVPPPPKKNAKAIVEAAV